MFKQVVGVLAWCVLLGSVAAVGCGDAAAGDGERDAGNGSDELCARDRDCDDDLFCNGLEYCAASHCVEGKAVICDDGIACTLDSCSEETKACENLPADEDGDGHFDDACLDVDDDPLGDDCDDTELSIYAGADELCDDFDNDCDGRTDETPSDFAWYLDGDRDGYGDDHEAAVFRCGQVSGRVRVAGDCDDTEEAVNPASAELCDDVDNDCKGGVDDGIYCGVCNCPLGPRQASADCLGGPTACTLASCNDGYADCDAAYANGCETELSTNENCGLCNQACDANAACTPSGSNYGCQCNTGYTGTGTSCSNVDECDADNGGCDPLSTCADTAGSRTCGACPSGYVRPSGSDSACAPALTALGLSVGGLLPAFDPAVTSYTINLSLDTPNISITPTTTTAGASITLNGGAVSSGIAWDSPTLNLGSNVVTITVSQSGRADTVYTLSVERGHEVYVKASNTGADDQFGSALALSDDGNTLAVGARQESGTATGINGGQASVGNNSYGAVYVFSRSGADWAQQAYIKASNTGANDYFGSSVALSVDGNTLAVGARREASAATGIDGNQADDSVLESGAVYVFSRAGATWSQQAYVKASNTGEFDAFGSSVALSDDGNTLAVGAQGEGSSATGVNGSQASNSALNSGAVYVFSRSGSDWAQEAYIKASNTGGGDLFGSALAIAADGNTLSVGANGEDSAATGINGTQADNSASYSGAVYVFSRSGSTWSQQAYIKASNTEGGDFFGIAVTLAADGNTLAVGANEEGSAATGINGNQASNSAGYSGAVYVFTRSGSTWSQEAYIKASNTGTTDSFGIAVSLSTDGNNLAVGAHREDSASAGVNGNQADNSGTNSGAVYVFSRSGSTWSQVVYLKASNAGANDAFGGVASLSGDGNTLAVGAHAESSAATGINGNQADNSASASGAVYVIR